MAEHASYLTLDRMQLGVSPPPEALHHVSACERCQAHVERLRAGETGAAREEQLPDWARSLSEVAPVPSVERPRSRGERPPRRWLSRPWLAAGFASVLCAGVGLWLGPLREPDAQPGPYVAAKGGPSVGVYVKRDGRVFLWDRAERLRAGDRIRLLIAPGGYPQVAVSARLDTGLVTLYRGRIEGASELPVAWAVDEQGDAERLSVVLSRGVLSDAELARRDRGEPLATELWAEELVLPKQPRQSDGQQGSGAR
jgi:hypothetical protein